jgi:MFS family permease
VAIGFSPNQIVFDILRAMSGVGPSLLMPNAAALLGSAWPDTRAKHDVQRKALAFCIFGAIAAAGYIVGGAWGAGIIENGYRWGWIYWSMAIVCAFVAIASWLVIPQSKGLTGRVSGTVDYLGSAVGVTGLTLLFIALK